MKTLLACFIGGLLASVFASNLGFYSLEVEAVIAAVASVPFALVLFTKDFSDGR